MSRPKKEGKKNIRKDISMDPEQYERLRITAGSRTDLSPG